MSWNYSTTDEIIATSIADGCWCMRCKNKCLFDPSTLKHFCTVCGDEWSSRQVYLAGDKEKSKIKPLTRLYIQAKSYEDLLSKLQNKRVVKTDNKRLSIKQFLAYVNSNDWMNVYEG